MSSPCAAAATALQSTNKSAMLVRQKKVIKTNSRAGKNSSLMCKRR